MAKVRSVCDNGLRSEWGDTVCFYITGDTTSTNGSGSETERINNILEQNTIVMPNPAQDRVTVMSSFRIRKVVFYDASGNKVLQVEPNDIHAALDLSTLPSGVYIISIMTNRGSVNKQLIKK